MFKNRFLLVLGLVSLLLVTMAVSRPFAETRVSSVAGANDFYQRHPGWNRNAEASDYYERHTNLNPVSIGDFALRHPEWVVSVPNAAVPVTGILAPSDYFQRHPTLSLTVANVADLTDYFIRHPELRAATTIDLSDYFLRH